jgi:pimeloyl-ACP methyl ester carboxylesterase
LAQPIPTDFLDLAVRESLKVPARVWLDAFAGMMEDDFIGDLRKIKAPTLDIWGARDAFTRRIDQDQLVAGIAGSRLAVYQDAGHAVHWEEPARFAKDLSDFVAGLGV